MLNRNQPKIGRALTGLPPLGLASRTADVLRQRRVRKRNRQQVISGWIRGSYIFGLPSKIFRVCCAVFRGCSAYQSLNVLSDWLQVGPLPYSYLSFLYDDIPSFEEFVTAEHAHSYDIAKISSFCGIACRTWLDMGRNK